MLGLQGQRPKVNLLYGQNKLEPLEAHGIYTISIGFIIEPEQAVVLRGPRLGGIIKQFINDCLWPELDFLVIDLPPGTGDIQLTLVQTIPVTGVVMVTTPQDVAVIDAVKAMNMFQLDNVKVPILGVIENMAWFTPAELPENKYMIFGDGGGQKLAELAMTEVIGQIPLVQAVREGGDQGKPIITQKDHPARQYIVTSTENLIKQVEKRNKNKEATTVVKMVN
jgi:ATP-binding protein involved in chromosome partitioning